MSQSHLTNIDTVSATRVYGVCLSLSSLPILSDHTTLIVHCTVSLQVLWMMHDELTVSAEQDIIIGAEYNAI